MVCHSLLFVFLVEAHVLIQWNMDGIVGHVEVERLVVFLRLVERLDRLQCQGFGSECFRAPILFEAGDGHQRSRFAILRMAVILSPK